MRESLTLSRAKEQSCLMQCLEHLFARSDRGQQMQIRVFKLRLRSVRGRASRPRFSAKCVWILCVGTEIAGMS